MVRLAFVYSDRVDAGEAELLAPVFSVADFKIDEVRWDDPDVAWSKFEAIFIREVPFSSEKSLAFATWMYKVSQSTPVFNAPEMISWNVDRSYIFDYEDRGVRIPEMALGENVEDARRKLADFSAEQVWVRPRAMWGAATGPLPAQSPETLASIKNLLDVSQGVILEAQLEESAHRQQVTFVTLNGRLSHAVRRRQLLDGEVGVYEACSPSESLVVAADYALKTSFDIWEDLDFSDFAQIPVYGNLDLTVIDGEPVLLGVDFIHPNVFFHVHPYATAKFFNAFLRQRNGSMNVSL
jgi:hypothetical protein